MSRVASARQPSPCARKRRHRFDVTPRRVEIAVGGERKREMRVAERQHVVVDALRRMLGQRLPAVADVDAAHLDALQQRGLIGDVDIGLGVHRAQRLVVEIERAVVLALRQQEQRAMPPDMGLERILLRPLLRRVVQPFDAFGRAPLHFQHMGDGMEGPEVARDCARRPGVPSAPRRHTRRIPPARRRTCPARSRIPATVSLHAPSTLETTERMTWLRPV